LGAPACPGAGAAHLMPKLAKGIAEERAYNIQLKGAQLAGLLIASVLPGREKWEGWQVSWLASGRAGRAGVHSQNRSSRSALTGRGSGRVCVV
jgi:hypothetical protein